MTDVRARAIRRQAPCSVCQKPILAETARGEIVDNIVCIECMSDGFARGDVVAVRRYPISLSREPEKIEPFEIRVGA